MTNQYQALLIFHTIEGVSATTITEHINAFDMSRLNILGVNVQDGFPQGLEQMEFEIIILHYSVFGIWPYSLNDQFLEFLAKSDSSYKIAIFQDEYRYCRNRFNFINTFDIDCIYTLIEPEFFKDVYEKHTNVRKIIYTIPGFAGDELLTLSSQLARPDSSRTIDIGYRGRQLDYSLGIGAYEKQYIADGFRPLVANSGLVIDIETEESKRIYGQAWHQFMANCRGTLGSESGVSIFDIDDRVHETCTLVKALAPTVSFSDLWNRYLHQFENNIYYRMISPRHFEAAAFRVCQILFDGKYSGILKPMVHYIPLSNDFSNIDEVLRLFKDPAVRNELTENCYRDLIGSGKHSYSKFIAEFDENLIQEGFSFNGSARQISTRNETTLVSKTAPMEAPMTNESSAAHLKIEEHVERRDWRMAFDALTTAMLQLKDCNHDTLNRLYRLALTLQLKYPVESASAPSVEALQPASKPNEVDSYWNSFTVNAPAFTSAEESLQYLEWRFDQYPFFREFMNLWGNHDGRVIVDYGCGPGNDLAGFLAHTNARKIIGIDISEKALAIARKRLALHNPDPGRIELIKTSDTTTDIPLGSNSVDYIYCEGVLHHTSDPVAILKEFYRILKPGSTACIMVYNRNSIWMHLYTAYQRMILENAYPGLTADEAFTRNIDGDSCPIARAYRPEEFIGECAMAGFRTEFVGGYISRLELQCLVQFYRSAATDGRLPEEHRTFLSKLTFDSTGFPLYDGKYAGMGGVYNLRKTT